MRRRAWILAMVAALAVAGGRAGTAHATDPTTGDPVIAAVGDMACAPVDPDYNGGAGTASNCGEAANSAQMETDPSIDMLLGLGDYQYGCGTAAEYAQTYGPTWGFFNSIIDPTAGNHEYSTKTNSADGSPCPDPNDAGQDYFAYFGAPARPATAGEYSFNIGKWHLISLNANCSKTNVGGCAATSAQTKWLQSDLAANTQPCTLAYWHQPRWTANATNASTYAPWWSALYAAHVDVVLNGHVHTYARFAPLDPNGNSDPANGIREVIVGTGGESLVSASPSASPAPVVNYRGFGYLRMVLHPTGYDAQFIASSGAVKDTFSGTCHGFSPPPSALQVSQTAPASVQADADAAYTVMVTNPGSVDQTNVTVTDNPPANAQSVSATPSTGSCSGAGPITCNLGTIPAGGSATVTVDTTPILPPTATNVAAAQSDQASQVTNSKVVSVTAAPNTSYVGVTNTGFSTASPALALGSTLQWSFVGPGSHSATDKTSGLGIFPDTGLVAPVAFRQTAFPAGGAYTFTDTATSKTIKLTVPMTAKPATGSTTTTFTLTWAAAAPPAGYSEDVQVMRPGTTTWASLFKATTATSGTFVPTKGTGTYKFRCRFRRTTGTGASAYTAAVSVKVS
ncbi:MAG TPA: metallophosphoesterase [Gaiellales bacterium]|nr:metallophosphoesterase [Gaiellales bacterium]